MNSITYKAGYKYLLIEEYEVQTMILPPQDIATDFILLAQNGLLAIKKYYAWDGPSGPTVDTPDFMRGSLIHDAFYQLMREGLLDYRVFRNQADHLLSQVCLADGMPSIRTLYVYESVKRWGIRNAMPGRKDNILVAP